MMAIGFPRLLMSTGLVLVTALPARAQDAAAQQLASAKPPSFEFDVRPVFKAYCFDCHGGGEKVEAHLDLRLKRFALVGGESGPAIVPGKPAASLLLERMKTGEMPPTEKKVPADKIALVERWIAAGAATLHDEPEHLPPGIDITPEERAFWAFQPIRRVEPPQLAGIVSHEGALAEQPAADIVRTPIDAFVLVKLREKKLRFSADAERLTLIRRVAFDLIGLPPTEAEIAEYLADTSGQAYENMLDRFLQSPHYGERWGRHWLDVAGYADSEGNGTDDTLRPYAYKYRDYVVRSFNADKPFDQFIIEQLAGDELVPPPWTNLPPEQIEKIVATGFLRTAANPTVGGGDLALNANQVVADTLKIVSSSLLGLTVGCAQCHDHRYDPIPQADYFRLRAVFEPALDPAHWRGPGQRLISLYTDADRAKAAAVDAEVAAMQTEFNAKQANYVAAAFEKELEKFPEDQRGPLRDAYNTAADKRTAEQKQLLEANPKVNLSAGVLYQYNEAAANELKADQAKIAAKQAEKPVEDFVSVLNETPGVLPETRVFYRGDHRQPTQAVKPGDLTIAAPEGQRLEIADKDPHTPTSGRRLALAKHLMNGRHPLVARVLVNRLWLHHFQRGIVETTGDFGMLGTRPTHPELLDWLADEFARQGWSLKQMHKLLMTSTAYRQSSVPRASSAGGADAEAVDARAIDAGNAYYWHYPVHRLEAEALRDRVLAVSGRLDLTQFGPAVPVSEDFVGQVVANDAPRRSIYLQARRTKPVSFLTAFDAPVMTLNCERRVPSTGAQQSLMLMNSEFVLKHAGLLAQRVRDETAQPPANAGAPAADAAAQAVPQPAAAVPAAADYPRQIAQAWRLAYQRPPTPEETELASRFLSEQVAHLRAGGDAKADHELAALTSLCQQLLSSNEFLYVD
jgi:hypothetical protein